MDYLPRIVEHRLSLLLRSHPVVRLEGPRGTGKTTTAGHLASSSIHLDSSPGLVELTQLDPDRILDGTAPRLVDEWRLAPSLWNHIHERTATAALPGRFLLASSATPQDYRNPSRDADQLPVLQLRTLTVTERPGGTPQVSLAGLAQGERSSSVPSPLSYRQLAAEAVRGGWPALADATLDEAIAYNTNYLRQVANADVPAVMWSRQPAARTLQLITALARHTNTDLNLAGIAADIRTTTGSRADRDTVRVGLEALSRVHLWEPQPAWQPPLRTNTRLRQRPRVHLTDPALACAALGYDPDQLADQPGMYSHIFTSMVIHDLRVYLEGSGARISHYRDETGLTVDAIIEYPGGGWAAVNTALGEHQLADAERRLHTLTDGRLDLDQAGRPRHQAIITATAASHTTRHGTRIIPLPTLTT